MCLSRPGVPLGGMLDLRGTQRIRSEGGLAPPVRLLHDKGVRGCAKKTGPKRLAWRRCRCQCGCGTIAASGSEARRTRAVTLTDPGSSRRATS